MKQFRVCDMHCDTLTVLKDNNIDFYDNNLHISLNKMKKSNYLCQCFAVFLNLNMKDPFIRCKEYINYYDKIMTNNNLIKPALTYNDIISNDINGYMSSILTIEEGEALEGDINNLTYFFKRGVRMITLTWNYPNQIGYPNINMTKDKKDINITDVDTKNGLTPFGIEVVKKMNELGMIIDVSHLSDAGFYDVIKYSTKPIVASHSNSRTVQNVARNLTDDMIIKIKANKGIIGINYCHDFISYSDSNQIPDIVAHIKHITEIGGIDICALGSDFDGIKTVNGMSDCSKMIDLYNALLNEGFLVEDIEKIFYKNFLRVFKEVC